MDRPTDLALALAVRVTGGYAERWVYADEVRGTLKRLGLEASAQQVAAWLGRLVREESLPMVESRVAPWGREQEYRLTQAGRTFLANQFPVLRRGI